MLSIQINLKCSCFSNIPWYYNLNLSLSFQVLIHENILVILSFRPPMLNSQQVIKNSRSKKWLSFLFSRFCAKMSIILKNSFIRLEIKQALFYSDQQLWADASLLWMFSLGVWEMINRSTTKLCYVTRSMRIGGPLFMKVTFWRPNKKGWNSVILSKECFGTWQLKKLPRDLAYGNEKAVCLSKTTHLHSFLNIKSSLHNKLC